ncbi:MAG: hypothetical protein E7241_03395 [Lachnospiraceae bacterium]|nr:hypothetical protein [Lachnospiraceae bacterium]
MAELFVEEKSLPVAYHKALMLLKEKGDVVDCADWNTTCLDTSMTIHITEPLSEPLISKCFIGGPGELQQYIMEMLDGILDFEVEKGNWVYTYHDRMVNCDGKNQLDFVVDELKRSPSSRRAVVLIRNSSDIGSEDPACLQHIQYFIHGGRLDCKVLFRSNDACKASFMNMFALIMLQKRIADRLGVPMGTYTHRANSYHCYERDFGSLDGYIKRISDNPDACITEYVGDWKDMMDDEIEAIFAKVEELRSH